VALRWRRNTAKVFTIAVSAGLAFTFPASGETRVPADRSLTLAQYIDLGMPSSEAGWTAAERSTARGVLRKLASQDPTRLPRFKSERSGALFEKLTQEEVFRRDALEGRIGEMTSHEFDQHGNKEFAELAYSDSLEAIYAPESTGGLLFDRELIQISELQLTKLLQLRAESEAVQAKLDATPSSSERGDDPDRAPAVDPTLHKAYLKGLDHLLLVGTSKLAVFSIAKDFTAEARADAASHLIEHVPQIVPLLSEESRARLDKILREVSSTPGADPRLAALLGTR
jgi:hypothetical protein